MTQAAALSPASQPALLDGNYVPLNADDPNVLTYLRVYKNQAVLMALNMSGSTQEINLNLAAQGFPSPKPKTLLTTLSSSPKPRALHKLTLDPFSIYIGQITK